jgi:hypothetical protein
MNGYHTYGLDEIAQRYDLTAHSLFELLAHFGESDDYWIAGGAARAFMLNQPITTDVDFFFKTQEAFEAFVARFVGDENKRIAATEHHTSTGARGSPPAKVALCHCCGLLVTIRMSSIRTFGTWTDDSRRTPRDR